MKIIWIVKKVTISELREAPPRASEIVWAFWLRRFQKKREYSKIKIWTVKIEAYRSFPGFYSMTSGKSLLK
jgi:hypothetical protein